MSKNGVLYIIWEDEDKISPKLNRSIASLKHHHPELPYHVANIPSDQGLLGKARMFDLSPFVNTLYLDSNTVVLGDLLFGFDKADQFGLACSICECPWARRYGGLKGDMVEYNTGVLFFSPWSKPVFDTWRTYASRIDATVAFIKNRKLQKSAPNDQAGFALAIEKSGLLPFILPLNWNFRPKWHNSFFGPIKIWHDYSDVPKAIINWNQNQSQENKPIQHALYSRPS